MNARKLLLAALSMVIPFPPSVRRRAEGEARASEAKRAAIALGYTLQDAQWAFDSYPEDPVGLLTLAREINQTPPRTLEAMRRSGPSGLSLHSFREWMRVCESVKAQRGKSKQRT